MNKEKLQNIGDAQALYRDLRRRLDPIRTISKAAPVISFDNGGDGLPLKELKVDIQPVQDLHGYSKPWAGGCGKNKCQPRSEGTTANNVTITVNEDGSLKLNGQANAAFTYRCHEDTNLFLPAGSYKATVGANVNFKIGDTGNTGDTIDFTLSQAGEVKFVLDISNGQSFTNLVVYPMIRVSTESATWEPYSNICPISGFNGVKVTRTGKNLLSLTEIVQGGILPETGVIDSGLTTRVASGFIPVKPGETYIGSVENGKVFVCFHCYDENKQNAGNTNILTNPYTIPEGVAYVRVVFRKDNTNANITPSEVTSGQLEEGSTASAYEPFGQTYSITFPSSAGTVYGGTLTIDEDGNGKLVVDQLISTLGNALAISNSSFAGTGKYVIYDHLNDLYYDPDNVTVKSEILRTIPYNSTEYRSAWSMSVYVSSNNVNKLGVFVPADYTLSQINDVLSGTSIVYKSTTPVTYHLSAPQVKTLLGQNNIWADTGDILKLTYRADNHVSSEVNEAKNESISRTIGYSSNILRLYDAAEDLPVKKMKIGIEPVQDLHGYSKPWVGGAGKNLLPMTVAGIKAANTSGTWSENAYTANGVTFTILTDNDGNVTGIKANGTASAAAALVVGEILGSESKSYTYNGLTSQGSDTTFRLYWTIDGTTRGPTGVLGDTQTATNITNVRVIVMDGYTASNLMFYPMIRLSSETDETFAPYSNICHISGHTGCNIVVKNLNMLHGIETTINQYINDNGNYSTSYNARLTTFIPCKPNTTYLLTRDIHHGLGDVTNLQAGASFWTKDKQFIYPRQVSERSGDFEFTTPSNCYYLRMVWGISATDACMTEVRTYNISFPTPTPDTVYGGTLTLNEDGSGELIAEWAKQTLDEISGYDGTTTVGTYPYKTFNSDLAIDQTTTTYNIKAEKLQSIRFNDSHVPFTVYSSSTLSKIVIIVPQGYTTEEFNANFAGSDVIYRLASPVVYNLSVDQVKLLLGYNQIYASTGDILEATYYKDVPMAYELEDVRKLFNSLLPAAGNSF